MHETLNSRKESIVHALEHGDFNLATRRLMDLCWDYFDNACIDQSIAIRSNYNQSKTLGESEVNQKDRGKTETEIRNLLQTLEQTSPQNHDLPDRSEHAFSGQDIRKGYKKSSRVFQLGDISLELKAGEITGIVGENGNGKTTLLRIIAGELHHDSGTLNYRLTEAKKPNGWYANKEHTAYIPQRVPRWFGTLKENLAFLAATHGFVGEDNQRRVDFYFHRMGLTNFGHLKWTELSSGYKLRFELVKTLIAAPKLLVLDEPLANLDLNAQQLLLQDLSQLSTSMREPMSIILSSQQLHEIEHVSSSILFLRNGAPVFTGRVDEFGKEREQNSFELAADAEAETLRQALKTIGIIQLEDKGTYSVVHTSVEVNAQGVLQALLHANIEVSYFRNISRSTKKLLNQ